MARQNEERLLPLALTGSLQLRIRRPDFHGAATCGLVGAVRPGVGR